MSQRPSTVRRSARFELTEYSPDRMRAIGERVNESIVGRIRRAEDVWDRPAPPLKRRMRSNSKQVGKDRLYQIQPYRTRLGYAEYKEKGKFSGGVPKKPVRDWDRTGFTLQSLKVLSARENQVTIGPDNPTAAARVRFNNARWRQWGVSPLDRQALLSAVRETSPIRVRSEVA